MKRREFVKLVASSAGVGILSSCNRPRARSDARFGRRVLVVAFDGLDPRITQSLMTEGRLPNFARLAQMGSFKPLGTSTPPHTPVAFSNIISGSDPGLHQIFDFIHRDPNPSKGAAIRPYFSTAEAEIAENQWALSLGGWRLPLTGDSTRLLRRGRAFWDHLVARGIDTDIYYLPSNYPPQTPEGPGRFRSISGMGTPDLLGSYGEFTMFTPDVSRRGRRVGGGRFVHLSMVNHRGTAELVGPPNFLREPNASGNVEPMKLPVEIVRDSTNRVAKIHISGNVVLLAEGEWSDWVPIEFPTEIPGTTLLNATGAPTSVGGMVRLFAKQVHPKFELYVSPVNIDPTQPINSISVPPEFSRQLARRHGRFHTLGIPEDTKALSHGALDEDQFLSQANAVMRERSEQFEQALASFKSGCLFFYFGDSDLIQHMFWRDQDPQHPGHDPEQSQQYGQVVKNVYTNADRIVGKALHHLGDDDTLIVLSDHGFTSFRRGFNLNTWLQEKGYIQLANRNQQGQQDLFRHVAWDGTRAYGLGMNGLYVNAAQRERHGIVKSADKRSLLEEISDRLMEVRDVEGESVVHRVDVVEDLYPNADPLIAPDLIIGYNDGYRASWETVLGSMPSELLVDNMDRWSGTHLIAADLIPGMLICNREITVAEPTICDIAPTILSAFSVPVPEEMTGRSLLKESTNVLN